MSSSYLVAIAPLPSWTEVVLRLSGMRPLCRSDYVLVTPIERDQLIRLGYAIDYERPPEPVPIAPSMGPTEEPTEEPDGEPIAVPMIEEVLEVGAGLDVSSAALGTAKLSDSVPTPVPTPVPAPAPGSTRRNRRGKPHATGG